MADDQRIINATSQNYDSFNRGTCPTTSNCVSLTTSNCTLSGNIDQEVLPIATSTATLIGPKITNLPKMNTKYFVAPEMLLPHDPDADFVAYNVRWDYEILEYEYQISGFPFKDNKWVTANALGVPNICYFSGPVPDEIIRHGTTISYDKDLYQKVSNSFSHGYRSKEVATGLLLLFLVLFLALIITLIIRFADN